MSAYNYYYGFLMTSTVASLCARFQQLAPVWAVTGLCLWYNIPLHLCNSDAIWEAKHLDLLKLHLFSWGMLHVVTVVLRAPINIAITDWLDTARKRTPAVGSQRTIRRATDVILGQFKSVLRCRFTSLESTPCISSSHGLHRNFQASSQNFTIYGGVRCNW